jgi:hypothetical protein
VLAFAVAAAGEFMSQMTTTSLAVNGRRQSAGPQKLAIRIPQSIMLRADEVIE